jgi:hypothetical protein
MAAQADQEHKPQQGVTTSIMAAAPILHFQGLSAADAMRCGSHVVAPPRSDPYGFFQQKHFMSQYSTNSKKDRNNNKVMSMSITGNIVMQSHICIPIQR